MLQVPDHGRADGARPPERKQRPWPPQRRLQLQLRLHGPHVQGLLVSLTTKHETAIDSLPLDIPLCLTRDCRRNLPQMRVIKNYG